MNKEQMGLYRDDGICVIKGGGPEVEKTKKKIHKIFQEERLSITMEGNTTSVDFLDVVMDLSSGTHKPYIKPNANTRYVSQMSSHPPAILRSIPESVSKRLSVISSGEEQFNQEVRHYQTAMEENYFTYYCHCPTQLKINSAQLEAGVTTKWVGPPSTHP